MKSGLFLAIMVIIFMFAVTSCSAPNAARNIATTSDIVENTFTDAATASDISDSPTNSLTDKAHSVYSGTLNNADVLMDIYRDGNTLTVFYVTKNSNTETSLQGTIDNDTITLAQKGRNNCLKGTVKSDDSLDVLYVSDRVQTQSVFELNSIFASGSAQERYPGFDTNEVESFVGSVKKYVKADDKESLSKLIDYPIDIYHDGSKITIDNANEFKKQYDVIFSETLKNSIINAYTKYMFSNSYGIMFGGNLTNIWIYDILDSGLRIMAINN